MRSLSYAPGIQSADDDVLARDAEMNIKALPNHNLYIRVLRRMSSDERLMKAFELTEFSRQLFRQGLRRRFPDLSEPELNKIFLKRLVQCHNRNY